MPRGAAYTSGQHRRDEKVPLDALDAELVACFGRLDGFLNRPWSVVNPSGRYTARPWEFVVCRAGTYPVLLPDPSARDVQGTCIAVRADSSRWMAERVTIRTTKSLIDSRSTLELGGHVDGYVLWSDGQRWRVVSEYRPRKWVGAYHLNFADQASAAIANGANTIDGRTWTGVNIGNAASVALVKGTGLVFTASATNHDYFNATRTSPLIRIPVLTGLLPFYGIVNHIIRVQCRVELTNADANYEGAFFGIEDNANPTNQSFHIKKNFDTAAVALNSYSTLSGTSTAGGSPPNATDDILSVTFEAPRAFGASSGAYDDTGYLNAENPWHSVIQTITTPLLDLNPDPYVFLGFQTVNANGSLVVTYKDFSIGYAEKWPHVNP